MPEPAAHPKISLRAYQVGPNPGYELEPAGPKRQWMDEFPGKAPYRCLPLNMANQGGWLVRSPCTFTARWNGKMGTDATTITFEDADPERMSRTIRSHFGGGIITFTLPWLFRTTEGYGIWVHGPPNWPMDNLQALDGIVETDWSHMTFTMNWKIMRRNTPVWFRKGDPVCMLTPFPLDLLETVEPQILDIRSDPALHQAHAEAVKSRAEMIRHNVQTGSLDWEKKYMRGEQSDGLLRQGHRTNFKLASFADKRRG